MSKKVDLAERYAREHPQLGLLGSIPVGLESALDEAAHASHAAVLDVGCGEGLTLRAITKAGFPLFVVGLDLSFERVRTTQNSGIKTLVGDALRLPVRDAAASLVICRHVVEHVEMDAMLIRELRRVLVLGGQCYLETPLRLRGAWYPYRNQDGQPVLDPTHVREYGDVAMVTKLLKENGFTVEHAEVVPLRYPLAHLFFRVLKRGKRPEALMRYALSYIKLGLRIPRYREARLLARAVRASGVV